MGNEASINLYARGGKILYTALKETKEGNMTDLTVESQKQKRIEMIRQALQEKAPTMYEELESSGQLQIFLEGHDKEMIDSFNEARNKLWEETLEKFLSFADASYNESLSPMG